LPTLGSLHLEQNSFPPLLLVPDKSLPQCLHFFAKNLISSLQCGHLLLCFLAILVNSTTSISSGVINIQMNETRGDRKNAIKRNLLKDIPLIFAYFPLKKHKIR
jgi:hypothetical protein